MVHCSRFVRSLLPSTVTSFASLHVLRWYDYMHVCLIPGAPILCGMIAIAANAALPPARTDPHWFRDTNTLWTALWGDGCAEDVLAP